MDFETDKYDRCIEFIKEARNVGNDWDYIKQTDISSLARMMKFPDDCVEKWNELVDKVKELEEETQIATGYIYDDDINNDIKIPSQKYSAWQVFKRNKLMEFGEKTARDSEQSAKKILDRLKLESYQEEPGKGLVMGYVQSGKTMNIESVITMGADIGFNVFIMLSGTIENLRKQGLNRLKKDIEYGAESNIKWKFIDKVDKQTDDMGELFENQNHTRVLTVCLKHVTCLQDLKRWLTEIVPITTQKRMKILFIDDEADQASLNTKKMVGEEENFDRSKINQLIIDIVNYKNFGAMNYISYTATPYGNFLNESGETSLYPRNFVISLPKSNQYIGASEIFGNREDIEDGLKIKNRIREEEIDELNDGNMPESLKDAICWFICTVAVQRYRKKNKPVSMLVHTDSKTIEHTNMNRMVISWLKNNKSTLFDRCKLIYLKQVEQLSKEDFFNVMTKYNEDKKHDVDDYPQFEEIENELRIILQEKVSPIKHSENDGRLKYHKGIHVVVDNSNNKKGFDENGDYIRLVYPSKSEFAVAMLAIGGNTLSRGLTLEGLTTSYFARKVFQVDTLMQMGRWFGYRTGYELLPRIWLTNDTLEKFEEMSYIEYRLREDLKTYDLGTKPSEYAPKIIGSHLTRFLLTSRNKAQGAIRAGAEYEKVKSQTVVFEKDKDIQKKNLSIYIDFIKYLINTKTIAQNDVDDNLVFRDVSFDEIKEKVFEKVEFYKNDRFFSNIKDFIEWMEEKEIRKNLKWDVIIENPNSKNTETILGYVIHKVNRSQRNKDGIVDLGVLRTKKDEYNAYYYENGIKGEFEKIQKPKLYIYIVDGESVPEKKDKDRIALDIGTDLGGINMYVPNIEKNDRDRIIYTTKV